MSEPPPVLALGAVRATLAAALRRSEAHVGAAALEPLAEALQGLTPPGHRHTPWQLLEHLRRSAEDFVRYLGRRDYRAPEWPAAYWPATRRPPDGAAWGRSVDAYRGAVEAVAAGLEDPDRPLLTAVPGAGAEGAPADHHLLRCALVLLDHNAYHLGQLVAARRALGAWPA